MSTLKPLAVALGTERFDARNLKLLVDDPLKQHIFDGYDPERVPYVDANDNIVARGLADLLAYTEKHPTEKIFAGTFTKRFDLALEGGGAFGFAHLGTLHA